MTTRGARPAHRPGLVLKSVGIIALIVVGFSILGTVLGRSLEKIDRSVAEISESAIPVNAAAYEMEINTLGTGLAVAKYLIRPDAAHRKRIDKDAADFASFLASYRSIARTEVERALLSDIDTEYRAFRATGERLLTGKDSQLQELDNLWSILRAATHLVEEALYGITPDGSELALKKHALLTKVESGIEAMSQQPIVTAQLPDPVADPGYEGLLIDVRASLDSLASLVIEPQEGKIVSDLNGQIVLAGAALGALHRIQQELAGNFTSFLEMREDLDALLDEEIQVIAAAELVQAREQSASALDAAFRTASIGGVIAATTLGLIIALVLITIVRPLRLVAMAAVAFGKGSLDRRVTVGNRDEIGDVASAFNEMAENVQRTKSELQQINADLEQLVNERTQDLKQTNSELQDEVRSHQATADQLSQAISQIEAAHAAKASLVGNVSHELRTPLNSILGFAEVLRMTSIEPAAPARYGEYLDAILSSGHRLLRIVNDTLDLSQAERGVLDINPEDVDLARAVAESLELTRWRAEEKQVEIETRVPEELPPVWADEVRIRQVLTNVIDNAIKFGPERKTVAVDLRCVKDQFVAVAVSDRGPGMSPKQQLDAFEPFGSDDPLIAREQGGPHVGLALSKRLLEMQHGRLSIASSPGNGTTVTIEVPIRPAHAG